MIDIAEQICLAVDEIVTNRLESINYDTTIIGTIIDNTHAKEYYYTCSNGSSQFIAYAQDTTYKINDSVQITIPNNDYNQQKIIIGKYVSKDDKPYIFTQPFSTIIDVSSNLINDNTEIISAGLLANDDYDRNEKNEIIQPNEYGKYPIQTKEVALWSKVFEEGYADFNRLGIQGQFRSWLSSLKAISGNYGYRLEVLSDNGEIIENSTLLSEWIKLYSKVLNKENINNPGLMDTTPDSWYEKVKEKLELTSEEGTTIKQAYIKTYEETENIKIKQDMLYAMLYANMQITEIYLDSMGDMYGNPFNFQSFFEQEKVYDISSIGTIYGMALFFYEKSGTFYSEDEEYLIYRTATGTKIPPNLFTKDPYICLGYDLSSFNSEQAILYSLDSKTYVVKDEVDQALNKKTIRLRWLHEFEDGQIKVVSEASELKNYEIRWYRFKMGAPSADEYSGVYWQRVEPSEISQFMYVLQPAVNSAIEQVKVIILYEGKIIRSNILEFTNEKEVANSATAELLAGLSIWCLDNSYGNYYIYGQNNNLLDESKANEILTFEARFADASILAEEYDIDIEAPPLTEAKEIIWEFPLYDSMIVVNGFNYNFLYEFTEEQRAILLDKSGKIQYNELQKLLGEGEEYNDSIFKLPGHFEDAIVKLINDTIYITRISSEDGKIVNSQDYRVNKTYSANKINNTVECSIKKNGLVYSTSKDLGFGLMGTNGTDATVVIDFNDNKVALTAEDAEEVLKITARLYDYNHKEIDPNNMDLDLKYDWSWENYLVNDTENNTDISLQQRYVINAEGDRELVDETIPINSCYLSHTSPIDITKKYFLVLKVKVSGWGDYDLITYKAIPIRANRHYRYVMGPTDIIYNSSGYIDYYKSPYEIYYAEKVTEYDTVPSDIEVVKVSSNWDIYDPYYEDEEPNKYIGLIDEETNILRPAAIYFGGVDPYGSICYVDEKIVWIQPLVIMKNQYPSSTLNRWDGKSIEINEDEGYIIAPAIAAGKKHSDNTFSGVMIGDWSNVEADKGGTAEDITKQTGVYGFNHGAMAYAFKEDGTAFIGKNGRGRIYFDGNDAKIYSATYATGTGMMIDLGGDDEAPYIDIKASDSSILLKAKKGESQIKFEGTGGHITISSSESKNPLEIGENFYVEWNGDLHANDAYLNDAYLKDAFLDDAFAKNIVASGNIIADIGYIGGWKIDDQKLTGGRVDSITYNDDTKTVEVDWKSCETLGLSAIYLDAPNAAICGGNLKPSKETSGNKLVMDLWGYLRVRDSGGALAGGLNNYFGCIDSGMPGVDGEGIGLAMDTIGSIKLTTSNIGLNYMPGGSYISLHNTGITIEAGTNSSRKLMAIYGSNIKFDNTQLEIIDIAPEQQKGIYARFA